jgi:hypothetical protein
MHGEHLAGVAGLAARPDCPRCAFAAEKYDVTRTEQSRQIPTTCGLNML